MGREREREHRSERKRDVEKDQSPADESSSGGRKRTKKEKNRSPSPPRSRSHTYSPSPRREISPKRRARSRSRSRDLPPSSRFGGGGYYGSRRFYDGRDNPNPSPCLGVFGMSLHTTERDLKHLFGRYGEVESVQVVYDRYSGRSRGFGFVYFTSTKDATRAKDHMVDAVIDGMKVRVDYSVTRGGGP
uniref:RRM domain-containing protein n=1 Tax=Globodera pallida TaxID=36090 RepID=A0A183CHI1_GLOPA